MRDVVVIGAGISGLAVAWHLQDRGLDVQVVEASDSVGGAIRTLIQDGCLLEQGPQALRAAGSATARLVEAVGLQDRVVGASSAAAKRLLVHKGALAPLSLSPAGLLGGGPLGLGTVLWALLEPFRGRRVVEGESIDAFVRRRFGPGIAEPLLDAFVAGIYAGDATQMEAEGGFPTLVGHEQAFGSVVLGMLRARRPERPAWLPGGSFTFDQGAQALPDGVAAALGNRVLLDAPVRMVERRDDGYRVRLADGALDAEQVVLATPPWVSARLVPAWADVFAQIPASPVAAVHLGWPAGQGPRLDGFGWLAPSRERRDVLGCIWVSSTFPHLAPGHDLVRVMMGGSRAPEWVDRDDAALIEHALDVLRQVQGPVDAPTLTQVARHQPGIPQYVAGHARRQRFFRDDQPGLHVIGWGLTGIGLSQGLDAAEALAGRIAGVR